MIDAVRMSAKKRLGKMTKTIDLREAEKHLKELVSLVAKGEHVVLSENNTPVAQLVPISHRLAGLHAGGIWTSDDFDEPLPQQFWIRET